MKLLILIIVAYLAYRAGKSWLMRNLQAPAQNGSHNPSIDDIMVKDPICGLYFPRREGVELRHEGQTYVFCSAACRDRYLEERKG